MTSLALGTVQFGLDYGIKNDRGRVPEEEVAEILRIAKRRGIDTIDTAAAYGDSEAVLGRTMGGDMPFRIVSKLPPAARSPLRDELMGSLGRLNVPALHGYLLHSFATWTQHPDLVVELVRCRNEGLVRKIGFSLYHPVEAERLMEAHVPMDLVQIPYSLLDRRFERLFEPLAAYGAEIHVRSVFLQGILLMDTDSLPDQFAPVHARIEMLQGFARELAVNVAALCLGFATSSSFVGKAIIGVDSLDDLKMDLDSYEDGKRVSSAIDSFPDISTADEQVILPVNWKAV